MAALKLSRLRRIFVRKCDKCGSKEPAYRVFDHNLCFACACAAPPDRVEFHMWKLGGPPGDAVALRRLLD